MSIDWDRLNKTQKYSLIATYHKNTPSEELFESMLYKNDIEYKQEVMFGKYRVDFLIDGRVYEINGGYHYTKEQRKKDKSRATYLLKHYGLDIKEITNEEVNKCFHGKISLGELLKPDERCIKEKFKF